MIDYEWKIKQLEEEARHEHAMRLLDEQRLDTHDRHFEAVNAAFETIRLSLQEIRDIQKQLAVDQAKLTVDQAKTDLMLRNLIETIAKEHSNGKAGK